MTVSGCAGRLYVPLFREYVDDTTCFSVVNAGDNPVDVTLTYNVTLGSFVGQAYTQTGTVAGGTRQVFYQGGDVPGTSPMPLPDGCAGAATVEATGGNVMAIVNDASGNPAAPTTSAAYNAVSDAMGAMKVALPLFRNQHMPTRANISTGIQAMNIGTGAANVRITLKDHTGAELNAGSDATQTIEPGAAYTWFPPLMTTVATDKYGSATIESDQPLVVIVNDASFAPPNSPYLMDSAIYNGIKADVQ